MINREAYPAPQVPTLDEAPSANPVRSRRAKIVATVGPASRTPDMLRRLYLAGVDTFRLNFSHGSHNDHLEAFRVIRKLEEEFGSPIGILQDLQGPKIRIGRLAAGPLDVAAGDSVTFRLPGENDAGSDIPLPHPEIFAAVARDHQLLIDDGRIRLVVTEHDATMIRASVLAGGRILDRKGVNLPDTVVALPALTEKDRTDLEFGLSLGVDWVALSFVQRPEDLMLARSLIGGHAGLIAKIEKPSALSHLEGIVGLADGIMIARGDLGVEIPPEDVPGRQKEIIRLCRQLGRPVIVATQMLESMITAPTPTRAEASDVATAVYDGADAVMLSAETASGQYPVEAVTIMNRIILRTEQHPFYAAALQATSPQAETADGAIATAAVDLAAAIASPALVVFSATGASGVRIASRRPRAPTLLLTTNPAVARRMALVWGICPLDEHATADHDTAPAVAIRAIQRVGLGQEGQKVVVVCGVPFGVPGTTNSIRISTLDGIKPSH